MGGKTWSREEELYFWRTIVPMSPKAAARTGKVVDWEQSALIMQRHFGKKARRNYTKLMLFEHYFQNITTGHESPRAADLVAEHKKHLKENGKDVYGIAAEHKTRSRRAAKGIGSPKPANKSPENPDGQAHLRADQPVARDTQTNNSINGSPHELGEVHRPLAYQLPGSANGYYGGHFYHGLPAVPQVFGAPWVSTGDSGYVSAASPSSYDGSPAALANIAGDGSDGTAANAMGRAE
ncbi:hypothetical protein HRG_003234 [Hirsutella rhossiliensis]|uniref:Uncharacterized protein n=1 Tax=Hirsutella rhossiliensis TaxID=111463 RepID=A0A9P8N032_9HYPO|nr:uncharacterized protein HRG_03234 [Hirsutella rhossiliensis]KAH0965218.1 hypothetical protein HRG_03234 [Hirsutella rhossiliensis]